MIGAICRKLNENSWAEIYLAGTFGRIDRTDHFSTDLGEEYWIYPLKENVGLYPGICIESSLNGELVLRLKETRRYTVRIRGNTDSDEEQVLPRFPNEGKNLKCDRDSDSVSFQFVNYLGKTRMVFPEYDIVLPFEVVPEKMNYEEDYIRLTEQLAEECAELLLEFSGSTSNVYRQSGEESKTLLEQFIFLRQFCYGQNILGLFEAIKRNPDRILNQDEELKPFGAGMPSSRFFRNPFQYSRSWTKMSGASNGQDLYLPKEIAVTRKFDRLDTPANRFIRYALHKFDAICIELIGSLGSDSNKRQAECLAEAAAIHAALENIFADSFFDDVGELGMMPQNNQVLQKREGYSQIFAAYSMVDLALQLDWKGKDEVYEGESKNVALLYEYWLFFELYRVICSIDGCVPVITDDHPFLMMNDGITISLREGEKSAQYFEVREHGVKINLYYNRTFSHEKFRMTKYEGSYSRPFRPDYTVAIFPDIYEGRNNGEIDAVRDGAVSYVHFDAKYRIEDLTAFIGNTDESSEEAQELEEEKTDSVLNNYKRGDLLKMHTYNDAIRRTVGSYVLYPGSFNGEKGKTFRLYDEILPGVGAFSIKPSIKKQGEETLKAFILRIIQSGIARDSRLKRMSYYSEMILSEPSRHGSSPVIMSEGTIKKGDLYVLGFIRARDYSPLLRNGKLKNGAEFYFYFYAIKGNDVYSHHKDLFKAAYFRFYRFDPKYNNGKYIIEPILCRIVSNELITRKKLTERLAETGIITKEEDHHADYYYILKVKVADDHFKRDELVVAEAIRQNGNDTFSAGSPKVLLY